MSVDKKRLGKEGEDIVVKFLERSGYLILEKNFTAKYGEIDIIAENGDFIAFVEVKARKPDSMVSGFEAVNKRKRGLIIKTASDYCCKHPSVLQPRFDIAEVTIDSGRVLSIDYIPNAYDTSGYNFIF